MDPISAAVATSEIIALCMGSGRRLVQYYRDYHDVEKDVAEVLLKIVAVWTKTEEQMAFLNDIWPSLDPSLQQIQHLLLGRLHFQLQTCISLLNDAIGAKSEMMSLRQILTKPGKMHKWRYAMSIKESLAQAVAEFMEWHRLFDPTCYLIARSQSADVDRLLATREHGAKSDSLKALAALRKSIRDLSAQSSQSGSDVSSRDFLESKSYIDDSAAQLAILEANGNYAIVDTMNVSPLADQRATSTDVKALCRALSRMDPFSFGLLRCCGVINRSPVMASESRLAFDIVFEIPHSLFQPRSLRNILKHENGTLRFRVDLSRHLATSILCLHSAGFVHKNIRPETILVFDQKNKTSRIPCLVGFEKFRLAESDTFRLGDVSEEREIYRHPLRRGTHPETDYVMQHDIYSLGVCLLEIGLWQSLVRQNESEGGFIPDEILEIDSFSNMTDTRKRAFGIKKRLTAIASNQLPGCVGEIFTQVVVSCLTCLDEANSWEQESDSSKDVDVGVRFIENVLMQLQEIVI